MSLLKFIKQKQFLLFIILTAFFFIFRNFLCHSFIFADDTDTSRLFLNFKDILLKEPSNGIYVSSFLDRIFAANLPFLLNMHPSFFKSAYFSTIEAFILIFFIMIFSYLMNKKANYACVIFFSASLILYAIQKQAYVLFVYDGFFRMVLPVFMFIALFLMCIKNKTKISYIFMPVLTFLCAISNEMICISVLTGLLLYSLIAFNKQDKNKYLYSICTLGAFIGLLLLFYTGAFFRKTPYLSLFIVDYIISIFNSIVEFSKEYCKYIFLNHIFAYILLIFQGIYIHLKLKKSKYKNKIISLIICFNTGILIFFALLIFLGKTHYHQGEYWIVHEDIHMIYSIILGAFNMTLAQTALNYKLINKQIINWVLVITSCLLMYKNYEFYQDIVIHNIDLVKIETYKAEKMLILANQKNKTAYLDKKCLIHPYLWGLWFSFDEHNENKIYKDSPYITYLNQFKKNKINVSYMFTGKEKAEKEFRANGGEFTQNELENINFNTLWN